MKLGASQLGDSQRVLETSRENKVLDAARHVNDQPKVRELSEDFEAIFLQLMLKSMRDTVPRSGFLDGGNGEEIFRSMLDAEYAKVMAGQSFSGLAESIEAELTRSLNGTQSGMVKASGERAYSLK